MVDIVLLTQLEETDIDGVTIYGGYAPQGAAHPFVVMRRAATARDYTTTKSDGLPLATFEVSAYDTTYPKAKVLANAVRMAIDGFKINTGDTTIRLLKLLDEGDVPYDPEWAAEFNDYGVQFIAELRFTETVPDFN